MAEATGPVADETNAVGAATRKGAKAVEEQAVQSQQTDRSSTAALSLNVQPWLIWDNFSQLILGKFAGPPFFFAENPTNPKLLDR